jgi:hypothetical protein
MWEIVNFTSRGMRGELTSMRYLAEYLAEWGTRWRSWFGFDPQWYHWNFSLTESFRPRYIPGVDSASNINEYQEYFLGVKAAGA